MLQQKQFIQSIENALAYLVALNMMVYGAAKWIQFGDISQNHTPVSQLTGMQMMWAFYAYSKPFAVLIGVLEITGAVLIIFRKTRLIACFLLSTILVNIILQDIFYGVHFGALKAALIYQTAIVIILWRHSTTLFLVVKEMTKIEKIYQNKREMLLIFTISFLLFILFRIAEYYVTIIF